MYSFNEMTLGSFISKLGDRTNSIIFGNDVDAVEEHGLDSFLPGP